MDSYKCGEYFELRQEAGLTSLLLQERKKLRKQRRREAEREKQEKIQFGLMDKPEPKGEAAVLVANRLP